MFVNKGILNILTADEHMVPAFWIKLVFRTIGFSEELKYQNLKGKSLSKSCPTTNSAQVYSET